MRHSLLLPQLSLRPSAQSRNKSKSSSKSRSKLPRRSQSKSPQTRTPALVRKKPMMIQSQSPKPQCARQIMNAQSQTTRSSRKRICVPILFLTCSRRPKGKSFTAGYSHKGSLRHTRRRSNCSKTCHSSSQSCRPTTVKSLASTSTMPY